ACLIFDGRQVVGGAAQAGLAEKPAADNRAEAAQAAPALLSVRRLPTQAGRLTPVRRRQETV
ncbi:MAG: hypothetical protein LBC26_06285, partial [Oscillospiraceae bacterium]|nr:hypothetical protein [Oscillospiraceae bacterium]